ncbi:MAG: hypothetical protein ACYC2T_06555 [Bacillota bacterium]
MFYVYAFAGMILQLFLLYMMLFVISNKGNKKEPVKEECAHH